ncbi:MAG: transglycosylase family protein [Miltoncostaeaceae bacterium]
MTVRRPRARRAPLLAVLTAAALIGASGLGAAPGADRLDAQREQVRALEEELLTIDAEAGAVADDHASQRARATALTGALADNRRSVAEAERAEASTRARLEERLVAIYVGGTPDPLTVLLRSGSLSQVEAAADIVRRVNRYDRNLADRIERHRAELAAARRRLAAQRAEARLAARRAAERIEELDDLLDRRRLVLGRARDVLDGLVAERERAAALQRAQIDAERAARDRAAADAPPATASPGGDPAPAEPAPQDTPSAPQPAPEPRSAPEPAPAPASGGDGPVAGGPSYAVLNRIAQCESGGNPRAISSSGTYRGKYQFAQGTWESVGGSGDPAAAPEAEQDLRAAILYRSSGPGPWPICGYR